MYIKQHQTIASVDNYYVWYQIQIRISIWFKRSHQLFIMFIIPGLNDPQKKRRIRSENSRQHCFIRICNSVQSCVQPLSQQLTYGDAWYILIRAASQRISRHKRNIESPICMMITCFQYHITCLWSSTHLPPAATSWWWRIEGSKYSSRFLL